MQDYRRLRVFRHAHTLAINVRKATNRFPRRGYASLKGQMTSAAESIPLNIAEGCGSDSPRELARFLSIGIRSTNELECQLELARAYGIMTTTGWNELSTDVINVRRILWGLRIKVQARVSPKSST